MASIIMVTLRSFGLAITATLCPREGARSLPGSTQRPGRDREDIAPAWHTTALIALIVAVAATGTLLTRRGVAVEAPVAPASQGAALYVQMTLVAWGLLFYVCRVGRRRSALSTLVGEGWTSARRAVTDLGLAAAGWILIEACELGWMRLFAPSGSAAVAAMLPHTALARAAWVVVSVSVGLSEEVVYRGYLQAQLAAFTRRPRAAWVLQALLFGLAHAEQGASAMARLAAYGLALGALARWRRSLLPGILCHVWTNLASGLLHP
jgi:membrane protease YdiL (CAAX protease family)